MAIPPPDTGPETIEVTEARQGRPGKRVLLILVASAGGAALILLLVLLFASPKLETSTDGEAGAPATEAYDQP